MFALESKVEIGNYVFNSVVDVVINKNLEELSNTAVIKMPNAFKVKQSGVLTFVENAIKAGDAVMINLSYKNVYDGLEFKGFVTKIKPTVPVEIVCEDEMYLLKRKKINKSWSSQVELKEILEEIVKGTGIKLSDKNMHIKFDKYIIKNATGAKVLEELKRKLAVKVFIDHTGSLYCGLGFVDKSQKVKYDLNFNLVDNKLEYRTEDDKLIKVRYTYIGKDNKQTQVEIGDDDGELRSFNTSVVSDADKLKDMAKAELEKLKYSGYAGSITSFLIPFATPGMVAKITDIENEQREGNYFIKKVIVSFGTRGARRQVFLGLKL